MDQLYIDIEINTANNETEIFTSISSFMALYVYRYLQIPKNVKLNFVRTQLPKSEGKLKLRSEVLKRELTDECILLKETANIQAIRDLRLPVYAKEGNTYIAGMCAVCRALVARQQSKEFDKLLGFKQSCLLAPSESSIWTRFCELDTIKALSSMIMKLESGATLMEMPQEVVRFEHHMNEPVRMHNIYKLAREQANLSAKKRKERVIIECSVPKEELPIEHRFAEGISFTIADLILFPIMAMIFEHCPHMLEYFPLTHSWLAEIDAFEPRCRQLLLDLHLNEVPVDVTKTKVLLSIPTCTATSLYKSDPKRYKPRNRIYTEQSVVDEALAKLQPLINECNSNSTITYGAKQIDWNLIEPTHAQSSALPKERLQRKREQLENLANAVVSLARNGDRIVDFCSGTGHLGILLALQLPECTIILMENKAISLERAKQRALELHLTNLQYYQCNIDYYMGAFDVGASLHACGSATDIVLQQCQRARAKFVCCPCCYGALQPMPHIQYPLSRRFSKLITEREYLHLAHTADQAHELGVTDCKPQLTLQGQLCMDIIDTDRRLKAEEQGYEVVVTRLQPEQCTPKNRLLVGRLPEAES